MKETRIPPVHPGEVLLEDFLKPLKYKPISVGKRDEGLPAQDQ